LKTCAPLTESAHYEERLAAAAEEIAALEDQHRLAREVRDRLVVEAINDGNSWRKVGGWARISSAHVHRVLAKGSAA
jgi:hypothetical protein